jgi:RNA polymerase sigma factor (sigma-70 family)
MLNMTDDTTTDLEILIDRLRRGDADARREMLQRAHSRLLRIAATVFQQDFPALHGRHELESVVSELWMRLVGALEATQPETVEGFFGLVFVKVRQVLLDMAQRQRRADALRIGRYRADESDGSADFDQADTTHDPGQLAVFTEFHEQIERLPEEQRRIFELHYYGGFSQAEIAQMLGLHRKRVSRLWLAATGRLAQWLEEFAAPLQ